MQYGKPEDVCIFMISNTKGCISQILKVIGPLGGYFDFLSPSRFKIQSDFNYRTSEIKLYSVRTLNRYLSQKNPILGRETATMSKFSVLIFETYCTTI